MKPLARSENLVVKNLLDETLFYDLQTHKAYCLNNTSAKVWEFCDGNNSPVKIAFYLTSYFNTPVSENLVLLALEDLDKQNLLAKQSFLTAKINNKSRREIVRQIGLTSLIALPIVSSLVAPKAIQAQSGGVVAGTCNSGSVCVCSGKSSNGAATCSSGGCFGTAPGCLCRNIFNCNPGGNFCEGTCST